MTSSAASTATSTPSSPTSIPVVRMTRPPDTPHGLKPGGFSVHHPRHRRDSPKALSAPLDVSGRVLIAVQDQSAVRTDMGAHREALLDTLPTAATVLRGIRRMDCFHSLAGPCCLAGEDGQEVAPSGVLNAFVQARLAASPVMEIAAVPIGDGRGASAEVRARLRWERQLSP